MLNPQILEYNYILTTLVHEYATNDGYSNGHLDLIFKREGIAGIADTIMWLATQMYLKDETLMPYNSDEVDIEPYDLCKDTLTFYLCSQ